MMMLVMVMEREMRSSSSSSRGRAIVRWYDGIGRMEGRTVAKMRMERIG